MGVKFFYQLNVWQRIRDLTIEIYKTTKSFPKEEMFGITSQLRRAITSVGANIAEGFGRYSFKDKNRFYYQARGSLIEVQNFLIISYKLEYINKNVYTSLFQESVETLKMLNSFIRGVSNIINH